MLQRKSVKLPFLFIVCILMMSYTPERQNIQSLDSGIAILETHVKRVAGIINTDSFRLAALHKIDQIITKYNSSMAEELRSEIANTIFEMSIKYSNLDVDLICATISHESAFTWRPTVVSRAGALGLMQIMPYTGYVLARAEGIPWTGKKEVLFDPINNIKLGCRYLSSLIHRYEIDGGLAAYNGGEGQAARWIASGKKDRMLVAETRKYVPAVLRLYEIYRN